MSGPYQLKFAPSILSADFARLGEQVKEAEAAGADYIHVDVMDGRFVPNITLGPPIVEAIRKATALPLDLHLMIVEPERFIPIFADLGADIMTVHYEACPHLNRVVHQIHECGARAGVAINPATPVLAFDEILDDIDLALVMSVNPGFGGQSFIGHALRKLSRVRELIDARGLGVELEVDGGVAPKTVRPVVEAGAQVLVAGSAVYNPRQSVAESLSVLRQCAHGEHSGEGLAEHDPRSDKWV